VTGERGERGWGNYREDAGVEFPNRVKTVVRFVLLLLGGFFAGSRLVEAADNWRDWHRWAVADPSAADLYRTSFWIDVAIVILTLSLTGLIYWLLRSNVQKS
jgi:hypothetical protein